MVTLRDSLRYVLVAHGNNLGCHKEPIEQALHIGVEEYDIVSTSPYNLELSKLKIVVQELRKQVIEIEQLIPAQHLLRLRSEVVRTQSLFYTEYMDILSYVTVQSYNRGVLALREYIYQMNCWRGHDL